MSVGRSVTTLVTKPLSGRLGEHEYCCRQLQYQLRNEKRERDTQPRIQKYNRKHVDRACVRSAKRERDGSAEYCERCDQVGREKDTRTSYAVGNHGKNQKHNTDAQAILS